MSRSGRKHERIHQCIRCDDYDDREKYCLFGAKDVFEPTVLKWCNGFKPIKEAPQ